MGGEVANRVGMNVSAFGAQHSGEPLAHPLLSFAGEPEAHRYVLRQRREAKSRAAESTATMLRPSPNPLPYALSEGVDSKPKKRSTIKPTFSLPHAAVSL